MIIVVARDVTDYDTYLATHRLSRAGNHRFRRYEDINGASSVHVCGIPADALTFLNLAYAWEIVLSHRLPVEFDPSWRLTARQKAVFDALNAQSGTITGVLASFERYGELGLSR